MKKHTILMLSNLYPPVVSGSSTQTSSLTRELCKRGHKVVVVTARVDHASPAYEEKDGVIIHRLPAFRLPRLAVAFNFPWLNYTFTPSNLKRIQKIIDEHQPEVIHLHNHMFDLGLSAALLGKKNKIPLVVTLHTVIRHSSKFYNLFLLPIDRYILKSFVVDKTDQVLCPDVNIAQYAREIFKRKDPAIVPYGIDMHTQPDPEVIKDIRARLGLEGRKVILSLGHIHEIRNRKDIIMALPDVLKAFPNTVIVMVGALSTDSPVKIAGRLGVEHAIVFAGPAMHKDIPSFLAMADIEAHWLNQEYPEKTSLGIASLESMAYGKTVLAAANPNTYGVGILKHGENIIIVKPDQPGELAKTIIELLHDKSRCMAIGERARQTIIDHFSWDRVCEQTIQAYEAVIEKKLSERTSILIEKTPDIP
jgi:glycosyltransferase involved in cell wall biosynthesis